MKQRTVYTIFESGMGEVLAVSNGKALTGLYFVGQKYQPAIGEDWLRKDRARVLARARRQFREYERGKRQQFDLPLALSGTDFQLGVWHALLMIPRGQTMSYGELARRIGRASAGRAVGAAVGHNPISVIVPCHRVLGVSGSLTGYAGGIERKTSLLKLEGVLLA